MTFKTQEVIYSRYITTLCVRSSILYSVQFTPSNFRTTSQAGLRLRHPPSGAPGTNTVGNARTNNITVISPNHDPITRHKQRDTRRVSLPKRVILCSLFFHFGHRIHNGFVTPARPPASGSWAFSCWWGFRGSGLGPPRLDSFCSPHNWT